MILLETLLRRWYVVAFITGYFWVSVRDRGWKASLQFALIASSVAFAAEYSSTRNGFPFSHYQYTEATRGDEIYLSNIPAFVPASYAVMIYAGRSLASLVARSKVALVALGAVATMAIDLVVDPVGVRGDQWFLGDLFHYATPHPWFGVPFGNFGGWLLVAAAVIALDLALSREPVRPTPWGLALAGGVIAFDVAIAFAIGATAVGFASLGVTGMILLALVAGRTPEVVS